jgi:uncharacterized protein YndB with AHSA1/START domain
MSNTATPAATRKISPPLTLSTEGDTHIVITRHFNAPPEVVYRAHTEPKIIQRWLLGPDGWTMPVCIFEPWPGGRMRYEFLNEKGHGFSITGEIQEIDPGRRIVHIERMHLPDPTPDCRGETTFEPEGDGTLMTIRLTTPNSETRTQMLSTGMAGGMEASYARLESLLPF